MNPARRTLLAGALAAVSSGLRAQPAPKRKLGILGIGKPEHLFGGNHDRFLEALASHGFVAGRNLEVVERFEMESPERLFANARELVTMHVDAIVTEGTPSTYAAQAATRIIPILTTVADPVAAGFARDLHRPGGNISGFSQNRATLARQQVELIRMLRPRSKTVAVVWEEPHPGMDALRRPFEQAARDASLQVQAFPFREGGFTRLLDDLLARRIDTLITPATIRKQDIEASVRSRVAVFAQSEDSVEDGALLSVQADGRDDYRQLATLVDKIFRGAHPADLPFLLPTRYLVAINARTADALGVPLSPELLLRAERVIR